MHSVDQTQRGSLAGTAAAQKDQGFARLDPQRQAVQDGSIADSKVNIAEFDNAHCRAFRNNVSANPHSPSIHWRTQDHPLRLAMREISSARNLCEDSVQMVSPEENEIVIPSSPI